MTYLLDTHIIIWLLFEPGKRSKTVQKILTDTNNTIIASAVNFWKISIKYHSEKLTLGSLSPDDLPHKLVEAGFTINDPSVSNASSLFKLLPLHHKDPFDRMLIWMAISNNYTLISDDQLVKQYKAQGLKLIP